MNKSALIKAKLLVAIARKMHVKPCNVSHGNTKLQPTKGKGGVKFIIWNLPCKKTCPFRTPHCEEKCYAQKSENLYKDCLPSRERNFQESLRNDFVERMVYTITQYAIHNKEAKVIVRIHESGDFYNLEYTEKWLEIMDKCKYMDNVRFICYTKSFPYFDGRTLPKNLAFRASIWDDTKPEFLDMIKRNKWNIYTAVDKFQKGDKFTRCRCSDCATCGKCWQKWKDIRCEIH